MTKLNVASLDFIELRESLKTYLTAQTKFKDYNWEGANLAILLDVLAYNAHIMAFYANMSICESFLDSAVLRNSAISISKSLGYVPHSKKSAIAYVDLQLTPQTSPATLLLPRYTKFTTRLDSTNYTFSNLEPKTAYRDANGKYFLTDVQLTEGDKLTYQWTQTAAAQRFVIPNSAIDIGTIYLEVQEAGSSNKEIFTLVQDINELDADSTVYFIQCNEEGLYEIYFGDDVLGKKPDVGSIINVTYLVSHGESPNGSSTFTITGPISGSTVIVTTKEVAANGQEEESIESIKFYAPKTYEIQNRAVTKTDYKTLIMHDFPYLDSVRVWGGEENVPPRYGYVYICPKPSTGYIMTERMKGYLRDTIIQNRNVVGIQSIIVDPEYLKIEIDAEVTFLGSKTTKQESVLEDIIRNTILSFSQTELVDFDSTFRYSKLVKVIDAVDPAITNNFTKIRMKAPIEPVWGSPRQYEIKYNNAIDRGDVEHNEPTLQTDPFMVDSLPHYLEDDGNGVVYMYRYVENNKVKTSDNVGSIDYINGVIVLSAFGPDSAYGDLTEVNLTVTPVKNDIISLRNQILIIEDEDIHITLVNESVS